MKANLKGISGIGACFYGIKNRVGSLETKQDNLDIDNFKTAPTDLSKLSNAVDNNFFKTLCMTDWLSKSVLLILRYQVLMD